MAKLIITEKDKSQAEWNANVPKGVWVYMFGNRFLGILACLVTVAVFLRTTNAWLNTTMFKVS